MADPRNLHRRIRQAATGWAGGSDVVLVIDQFEELFTLCVDERERAVFVDALVTAATDPASRTRVVLGIRADFLGHCAHHPSLVTALRDTQVLIGPMSAEELRVAITGPAQQAGYRVETALIARVVADASQQLGMLPLVSHALLQTWRRRQGPVMTLAAYNTIGGIEYAVARTAEQTYQALDAEQQRIAEQIFLRLTALGDGTDDTKRRVARDELDDDNPNTALVLDALIQTRLITAGYNSVEIAHEALIRHWPRLRDWLADDRDGHRIHRQLTEATTEWERHQRDDGLLYRGARLAAWQDRRLDRLNDTERVFLDTSLRAVERERTARIRRLRWLLTAMSVVVVVVSLLAGLAVMQTSRAAEERDIAFSRQLATDARTQLEVDPELALLLAIEAVKVKPTAEADAVLRRAIVDSRALATLRTGDDSVTDVVVSPDGHRIVTVDDDRGSLRVWERPRQGGTWSAPRVLSTANTQLRLPVFSPDGRFLATATTTMDNTTGPSYPIQVWDLDHAREPVTADDQIIRVNDLAFSPDGRQVVIRNGDGVWSVDAAGGRDPVLLHVYDDKYAGCAFSPDDRYTACLAYDGIVIEDLMGQKEPVKLLDERGLTRLAFSPDGRRLAVGNSDGSVRVWDTDGREFPVHRVHDGAVSSVEFSPDGHSLVSTGDDGTVRITNYNSAANSLILRGHHGEVHAATFSPDGRWIAGGGGDGTLRLWMATPDEAITLGGHTGPVRVASFTPDASHIVSGGEDGTVQMWDRDGSNPTILHQHTIGGTGAIGIAGVTGVTDVDVSRDGRLIASISAYGELRVWNTSTHTTKLITVGSGAPHDNNGYAGVEFTPDGRIVTNELSDDFRIWNADGTSVRLRAGNHRQWQFVKTVLSPDGTQVAVPDERGGVQLRELNGSRTSLEFASSRRKVIALTFSHDGRHLAIVDDNDTVGIWPVNGGGGPLRLSGNQKTLTSVAYSPDGHYVATCSLDGAVYIWDAAGNREPVVYRYNASVESIAFSPDGRQLLTAHDDGTIQIQQCGACGTTQQILELAKSHTTRQLTTAEKEIFGLTRH